MIIINNVNIIESNDIVFSPEEFMKDLNSNGYEVTGSLNINCIFTRNKETGVEEAYVIPGAVGKFDPDKAEDSLMITIEFFMRGLRKIFNKPPAARGN